AGSRSSRCSRAPLPRASPVRLFLPDQSFGDVRLSDYSGKYVVLFSTRPTSPSCVRPRSWPSRTGPRSSGGSTASCWPAAPTRTFVHLAWTNTPRQDGGLGRVSMPLLADRSQAAFQHADKHGEVCPAGWRPGDRAMKPRPQPQQGVLSVPDGGGGPQPPDSPRRCRCRSTRKARAAAPPEGDKAASSSQPEPEVKPAGSRIFPWLDEKGLQGARLRPLGPAAPAGKRRTELLRFMIKLATGNYFEAGD
uniref:thioredoxin-dependent peroxiredoxin n=1 Tax=Macrostomum lignano TaxID=282301 RepID=A0A1I8JPP4_9PLAT